MYDVEFGCPAGDESDDSYGDVDLGYSCPKQEAPDVSISHEGGNLVALKRAINLGDVHLVGQLLDTGMDVDCRLGCDWTPLMYTVYASHYDLAEMLLDRGASANYSKDQYTVLMAACTAPASEDKIAKCVELLLSRKAEPNIVSKSRMTSLMMAARNGYTQVISLLVSHGAEINAQESSGHTALAIAAQYGKERAVLKLLQLGADKTIRSKAGKTAADLAKMYKQHKIYRLLAMPGGDTENTELSSKRSPHMLADYKESSTRLDDMELLLHGLNLEHLSNIMSEHDMTWTDLCTVEKEDLEKMGITDPEDQRKILVAIHDMNLDQLDLENTFMQLGNPDSCGEELYNFLISFRQQCSYLKEVVQDIIRKFPSHASELALSLDPNRESQNVCNELVALTEDLQKEVACLRCLFDKLNASQDPCRLILPAPPSRGSWGRKAVKIGLLLGAGVAFLLWQAKRKHAFCKRFPAVY